MKYRYVFMLGRPGCGKSAIFRGVEKRLLRSGRTTSLQRLDDFYRIWAAIEHDDALEAAGQDRIYSQRDDEGLPSVTNFDLLDLVLREVSSDVLHIDRHDHIVFIEFARPSYVQALTAFDQRILDDCLVIYVDVDFETCWARNIARHEAAVAEGGDDHLTPLEIMDKFYRYDDRDALMQHLTDRGIPVSLLDNNAEGEAHLRVLVEQLIRELF
jgi:hypothetical protein